GNGERGGGRALLETGAQRRRLEAGPQHRGRFGELRPELLDLGAVLRPLLQAGHQTRALARLEAAEGFEREQLLDLGVVSHRSTSTRAVRSLRIASSARDLTVPSGRPRAPAPPVCYTPPKYISSITSRCACGRMSSAARTDASSAGR